MPIRLSDYLKKEYGEKVYRLSLSSGCTCPNRDGSIYYDIKSDEYHIVDSKVVDSYIAESNTKKSNIVDIGTLKSNIAASDIGTPNDCMVRLTGGCTFCSEGGSGEFAAGNMQADKNLPDIDAQIEFAKKVIQKKTDAKKFIAYFQSYTNTYGDVKRLSELYHRTISREEIVALSIGTRPDCIDDNILDMLKELNTIKPVWIELGLQTIHEETARRINRGYKLKTFEDTYYRLKNAGITVIVHVILGLPGESKEDMLETVRFLTGLKPTLDGIKLQNLQVLKGTKMYEELKTLMGTKIYEELNTAQDDSAYDIESSGSALNYRSMTMEEYTDLVAEC
ncbi:MAG: TIGR01212 family radical SAM protein, partial [Succinivibrio sp.]|nr:TIGR01212 family radical SAM protein [Succinivibrio sp.]